MTKDKKNIFSRIIEAGSAQLDKVVTKAKLDAQSNIVQIEQLHKSNQRMPVDPLQDEDTFPQKAVFEDMTYSVGIQGFQEKVNKLSYYFLRQMALKDGVVASIIQTRQNQGAAYSKPSRIKYQKGFQIKLENEEEIIEDIIEALKTDKQFEYESSTPTDTAEEDKLLLEGQTAGGLAAEDLYGNQPYPPAEIKELITTKDNLISLESQEEKLLTEKELKRLAKRVLNKKVRPRIRALEKLIENCGYADHRPFISKKWNFDSFLRAIIRDRYTYDQFAVEFVPDQVGNMHYFVPVDGGTIRYSTIDLMHYKDFQEIGQPYDILYPEKEMEELLQRDILNLDEEKLEKNEYKYVQVIDGRVQRAFTEDELAMGMANCTTDLWSNGYSISELELLLSIVSSHLFTENFNKQFFVNGFASKGILHIKNEVPKRKLESFRVMWQHLLRGGRNSFTTPIMSGVDDVKWIPLTQSHSDMEFSNWMQYLIRVICAVYQIDPFEIGLGMREMGEAGAALSGDNSSVKLLQSRTKGFVPLMRFLETFINNNIIKKIDANFRFEFVGLEEEEPLQATERQLKEVRFKKTINEIREEDGLPPIPGMDEVILDPTYKAFYDMYSPVGKVRAAEQANAELATQVHLTAVEEQAANNQEIPPGRPQQDKKVEAKESTQQKMKNDSKK